MDRGYIQNTIRNALYSYILYSKAGIRIHNGGENEEEREALIKECDEDPILSKVRVQLTNVQDYYRSSLVNMTCLLFDRNFWLLPECDGYSENPHKRGVKIGIMGVEQTPITTYGAIAVNSRGMGVTIINGRVTYGVNYNSTNSRMLPVEFLEDIWNGILSFDSFATSHQRSGNISHWGGMSSIKSNPFTGDESHWLSEMSADELKQGLANFEASKCFAYVTKQDFDEIFHGKQLTDELRTVLHEWCKKHSDALDTPADSE